MIFYLATAIGRHGLAALGAGLVGRATRHDGAPAVTAVTYDRVLGAGRARAGAYVFADLERLGPRDAERAARLHRALEAAGSRALNHPTRSLRRYALLRALHEGGINRFDVYRVSEARRPRRFPVFLRADGGGHTRLLHTPAELAAALDDLDRRGRSRETATVVELCDTADAAGRYVRYAALAVAGRVIPWRAAIARAWDGAGAEGGDEARRLAGTYLATNPHAGALREICALAAIDWGLVEYGLLDGRPQVWGIDTDPDLGVGAAGAQAPVPARVSGSTGPHAGLGAAESPRGEAAGDGDARLRCLRDVLRALDPPAGAPRRAWIPTRLPRHGRARALGVRALAALRERVKCLGDRLPRRPGAGTRPPV
jgi:hypothetical protein